MALKRLSLKKSGSARGLKLKPGPGPNPSNEASLIDFGEDSPRPPPPATPTPSPVAETRVLENLLDRTPPQSPCGSLPRPLHPTPAVDWDARPLPPPPAYDAVAQDEDDMEV